jgi:two-component system nitrogen regulation response regulator GlnG
VRVRVIAATESDLDGAIDDGTFRAPLLHRLSSYVIWIPPLRDRREDIPRLVVEFLQQELARVGRTDCLERTDERASAWLPLELMRLLFLHPWPGNVRQLRNVIRQLVISNRDAPVARLDEENERVLRAAPAPGAPRDALTIEEDELAAALRRNAWELVPTARELGISRAALYRLIDKNPRLRKASDIERAELERCLRECGGDIEMAATRLEVSRRALQMRVTELGL